MQAGQTANGFRTLKAGLVKASLMNLGCMCYLTLCHQYLEIKSAHMCFACCMVHRLALTPELLSLYSGIHFHAYSSVTPLNLIS